jgi:3-hydroxymyristoyl/3-hydroxydecanoyl-(acyl carrier protein) dehydratase
VTEVEILDERRSGEGCERTIRIPRAIGCVNGHFPGLPIIPGFVQLGWAIEAARPLIAITAFLRRVQSLKFKKLLRPGETVVLTAERTANIVRFSLVREGAIVSSGSLIFDGADATLR